MSAALQAIVEGLRAAQFGVAPALAGALLHSLWQLALLAAMAATALALLERRSAALRHLVGMGFLMAMLVVPVLAFARFWWRPAAEANGGLLSAMSIDASGAAQGVFVLQSNALAASCSALWLLGVTLMLLRHAGGWGQVRALERHPFAPLPAAWQARVDELRAALRITRAVSVRLADDVVAPFTARCLRPVIWLPQSLIARLPVAQVEALIAHELAHIRRLDWLWNGLQCVVESLLFFHPAVWWLGRRIRREREHACDDLAVAACGDAIALAEALTDLERHRHPLPRLLLAAHGGSLMKRITHLLSGPPTHSRWWLPLGLVALLGSGAVLAAQLQPSRAPGLRIVSSSNGALGPGDYRTITANGLDGQRMYRASLDSQGRLTESYREDGQPRPIDAGVRRWLDGVARLSVPPAPPAPPAPQAPPAPGAPPAPPSPMDFAGMPDMPAPAAPPAPEPPPVPAAPPKPPAPPAIEQSRAFQAILRQVMGDPAVASRVGSPAAVVPGSVSGNLRTGGSGPGASDDGGAARLQFLLRGPNGRVRVDVDAAVEGGSWNVATLDLAPASG